MLNPTFFKKIVKTCGTPSLRIQAPFPMISCLLSVQFVGTLRRDVSRKTAKAGVRAGSKITRRFDTSLFS